jgi:hypothetical protein
VEHTRTKKLIVASPSQCVDANKQTPERSFAFLIACLLVSLLTRQAPYESYSCFSLKAGFLSSEGQTSFMYNAHYLVLSKEYKNSWKLFQLTGSSRLTTANNIVLIMNKYCKATMRTPRHCSPSLSLFVEAPVCVCVCMLVCVFVCAKQPCIRYTCYIQHELVLIT